MDGVPNPRVPRKRSSIALMLAMLLLPSLRLQAQDTPTQDPAATLHVYVNLIQVPVLLLDSYRHPKPPVPPSRFMVSVQGRQPFRPQHVRMEGDDPLALTLLIDASNPNEQLWQNLPKALGPLMESLNSYDTVELYALDGCALRRFGGPTSPNGSLLQSRVEEAVAIKPYVLRAKQAGQCVNRVGLWDAMRYITVQLSTRNARRVILMVTDGQPAASNDDMLKLGQVMDSVSVSAFAVAHDAFASSGPGFNRQAAGPFAANRAAFTEADFLATECEMTGGMVLNTSSRGLSKALARAISLVRGRYIVEFPRPEGLAAGSYRLEVSVGDRFAFIRPGGASAPIAEEKESRDPTVQHGLSHPEAETPATSYDTGAAAQTPVK